MNIGIYVLNTVVLAIAVVIIADIILAANGKPTFSEVITFMSFAKDWTFFPILFGTLGGHWFIPHKPLIKKNWLSILILVVLAVLYQLFYTYIIEIDGSITFYLWTGLGTLFWGQERPKKSGYLPLK